MDDRGWDVGLSSAGINGEIVTVGVTVAVVGRVVLVLVHWVLLYVMHRVYQLINFVNY